MNIYFCSKWFANLVWSIGINSIYSGQLLNSNLRNLVPVVWKDGPNLMVYSYPQNINYSVRWKMITSCRDLYLFVHLPRSSYWLLVSTYQSLISPPCMLSIGIMNWPCKVSLVVDGAQLLLIRTWPTNRLPGCTISRCLTHLAVGGIDSTPLLYSAPQNIKDPSTH